MRDMLIAARVEGDSVSPIQSKMARAALGLGVRQLAELSGVSAATIVKYEGGEHRLHHRTLKALREALESQGVEFTDSDGVRRRPSP
jgi:transcriptional regulator with XRE-family HTH domain